MLYVGWHFLPLSGSLLIAVNECKRTRALSGEFLYPLTSSADSAPSVGASVSAPQVTKLCEFLPLSISLPVHILVFYAKCVLCNVIGQVHACICGCGIYMNE